jgi:hypothetical protein
MTSIFANRPLRARLDGAPLDPGLGRYAVSAFVRQTSTRRPWPSWSSPTRRPTP